MKRTSRSTPRPFLKWVGGKGQLLPELLARVEKAGEFGRYHEPFVGGGALFFELVRQKVLSKKKAWLSDNNLPLISAYQAVQDDVECVIELLNAHKSKHSEKYFYAVRAKVPKNLNEQAARIIFLNKTCYNGLYRENMKGEFNAPFGKYKNPQICDEENLRKVSESLKKAKMEHRHFAEVKEFAERDDLVYFDPPYYPISKTSSFTSYDKRGFGEDSQRLLKEVCVHLHEKGVKILLSNSVAPLIIELYEGLPDFTIDKVLAKRSVNSRGDRRGKISEALIRNF